jgi:chromosome segregation protein
VSAIVGPNGCGKSNLVDAILWVLGEQRPSLMRLKQMGDIVFSGGGSRPPAGVAQVTLILESDDGHWEETDGRLELQRKVFKSGPSEFRLNGRMVRLKDVFDELAGVGLGTRSYSIIEQGRVGQVLSARPIDRRALLEEAAGITRYKARKHEAELKLEHTRQNLLRLDDVIGEVKRTLRQIKRQARQAERHQKLENELKAHLRRLFVIEAHRVDEHRREITKRRAQAQNEVAAAASALASSEADLGQARRDLESSRDEIAAARDEVATLLGSRERLEAFLERSADLIDTLRASLDHAKTETSTLQSNRGLLDHRISDARARHQEMLAELEKVRTDKGEAEKVHEAATARQQATESEASSLRQDLLRTISSLTSSRNRLGDLERDRDRLSYALGQIQQENQRLEVRHRELSKAVKQATAKSREAAETARRIASRRRELADERDRLREASNNAKHDAEALGHDLWELRHRLHGIERELARQAAAAEALREIIPDEHLAGTLGDYLHPEADLAPVLDRAWREWLELPVVLVRDLDDRQIEAANRLEGRIRLVAAENPPSAEKVEPPAGARDLLREARVDDRHLGWVSRALPPTFACDDPKRAVEIADANPGAIVVCGSGVLRRGRVLEPPTTGDRHPGALVLRTEQDALRTSIDDLAARSETTSANHDQISLELENTIEALSGIDGELVTAEQERARTAAIEETHTHDLARVQREIESLAREKERLGAESTETDERLGRLSEEVEELDQRSHNLEQAVEEAANQLAERREGTAEALRTLDRWLAEERIAGERAETSAAELNRLETEAGSLEERVAGLTSESERLAKDKDDTEKEVVRSRARLAEEQGLLAAAREHERRISEQTENVAARVEKLDKEVRGRREEHDRQREQLHSIEVEQTRSAGELERLREHAADELAVGLEELLEIEPEAEDDADVLRTDIDGIRAKLERLGPVNLLALQELEELEERSEFLGGQRKDLVEALKSLDETIREIDATCTERFVATFEQVNEVFRETFSTLFGGGSARLDLVDEDDPLESGIDITAQPPGKKNQSVQLLSGGEKALAALSLLLALFRIKPAPFCILDEVDAPLDDANVTRFSDLVHAMTEHTQFVLVTHNRRTMARADLMYGVTMEEAGISKVVSVRMEEAV